MCSPSSEEVALPAKSTTTSVREVPDMTSCSYCARWNEPRDPARIFGNTYYVGTNGLGSVLITSADGHVLIDGALHESAPLILANIRALGFEPGDVKLVLNSHAHFDHAGGIGVLQKATGAVVAASPNSASVLMAGSPGTDDPQYLELIDIPMTPVDSVRIISDGETLHVGPLELTAHFTPGHTTGGTTWTWTSCEGDNCLNLVYADSITPVSEDGFRFSNNTRYPTILDDFDRSFSLLESLSCDVLITPHPGASRLFERMQNDSKSPDELIDRTACARYVSSARDRLAQRIESEKQENRD